MHASLIVLNGKQKGREIPLPETLFVVGRDPLCHLRPHSILVSRRHCAIARWAGRILVRDLKSANGTFLNHQKVNLQVMVRHGDILQIGDLSFSFQIVPNPTDQLPELTEDSLRWLIESTGDSDVLDPAASTWMEPLVPQEDAKPVPENKSGRRPKEPGSKGLSAGKYLKDYFHQKH